MVGVNRRPKKRQKSDQKLRQFYNKFIEWIKKRQIYDIEFNFGFVKFKMR